MGKPSQTPPTLAISAGDPRGIGPEIIVKALADPELRGRGDFHVYGDPSAVVAAGARAGIQSYWRESVRSECTGAGPGVTLITDGPSDSGGHTGPSPIGGEVSYRAFMDAIEAARDGRADGIVTGPISKESWAMAGYAGAGGHTEALAAAFPGGPHAMLFVSPSLRVILATTHIPLRAVVTELSAQRIEETIGLAAEACREMGVTSPRLVVCGINPHAGEGGLLGHEDGELIVPAIEQARRDGRDVTGPLAAEAAFVHAHAGRYDCVVAMYHDQGLIPVKLLERDRAVNVTVGLPVVRTSPAHGTAFDIAGLNLADAGSMRASIELALEMASRRAMNPPGGVA